MHMSINIAIFYTCPGKSAKVPENLTQCPGMGLKNYGRYNYYEPKNLAIIYYIIGNG